LTDGLGDGDGGINDLGVDVGAVLRVDVYNVPKAGTGFDVDGINGLIGAIVEFDCTCWHW